MPTYITVKQSPRYHQMTLDELFGYEESNFDFYATSDSNTRTIAVESVSKRFLKTIDVYDLIYKLVCFNSSTKWLRDKPRQELYYSFRIPKKSGGLRQIDAPNEELKAALYQLKAIFEGDFHALYHTTAFAYIKHRSTIDCMKRHQMNKSRWYLKLDLSNFFGSITLDYAMKILSMIFPFSEVVKVREGKEALKTALSLCFLNDGLPQGTPISPLITNIIMIPVDFVIANALKNFKIETKDGEEMTQRFIYTRYADDFQISSRYNFKFRDIEKFVVDTLDSFGAPFKIKEAKTRYGSTAGSNWNLGIMINQENKMTVGCQKKRQFQAMLHNYVADKKSGINWSYNDIQYLEGLRNYYTSVEGNTISGIINHLSNKFGVDIISLIKNDLKSI